MAQQAQVEQSPPASPLLPAASSGAAEPVLKSPADALLQAVVLQHFAVMKQQSDACRQLLARFQERSRMTLPPDNQSQWLVDRMNADPSMTSATREVDDVEMVLIALLDSSGKLSVPARVDGFFALMCRVQKMDHMVLLLTVLESHSTEVCRQRFLLAGGLKVLQQWLHNAREGDNVDLMTFILRVTAQLPFNKDSVKESGIGKTIKKLTRYTNDSRDVSPLVDLANEVVQSWKTELEKAKQNGANPTAETKAPLAPLPRLVYQVDAKLAAGREATLRSAVGVAETKEPASVPVVASPTSRNGGQGLGAADKAKLTLRKPDERREIAAKNAALTPKTPEAKLVARLISGAKQLRKTVPLDGPAAASESTLHRTPGTLAGSTLATQRQLSAPFKELPRETPEPAPRLNLPELLSFGQASSRPDTKAGSRKIKWADEGGKNLVQVHEFEVDTITRVTADYRGSKSYRDLVRLERTGAGKVLRHRNEEETEEEAVPMEVQNAAVEQKPAIAWRRPTKLKPAEGVEPCEVVSTELAVQNDRLSAVVEPVFFDDIPDNPAGSLSVEASLETRAPRIPFTAEEAGIDLYVDFAPTKRSFAAVDYSEAPPSKQARTEAAEASLPASEPDSTQIVSSVPEALRNLHPAMLQLLTDERNLTAILNEDGSVNEQKLQILLDGCRQVQQEFNTQPAQPTRNDDVYGLGAPRGAPSGYHDYHSSPPAGDVYGSFPARSPVGYDYRDAPRSMPAAPHRQPMYGQRSAEGRREVDLPPSKVPCKFFGTRTGCKHGDQCRFLHLSGDNRRR